jgi:starch-binding outer membrane protein, SusD/RagB family
MKQFAIFIFFMSLLFFILSLALLSCKKLVDVPLPQAEIQSQSVFASKESAESALAGLYNQMMTVSLGFANGGLTLYPALTADELFNTAPSTDLDQFTANNIQPSNSIGLNSRLWSAAYKNLYQANAVLEGLEASSLPPSAKNALLGEAKFIRAFHHLFLAGLFGDVPLITTTAYGVNATLPRSPASEVLEQSVNDLLDALSLLPEAYPSPARVRPNKWAAAALLARAYLYKEEWANAEEQATALINAGPYSLVPLAQVFLAGSSEAIWQLMPVSSVNNTSEGNSFIPSSASSRPAYALTDSLLSAFEPGDGRKTVWTKTNMVNAQPYTFPYKYKVRSGPPPYTEYYMVLRLAEQYLIRAEARAYQEKITEARDDLNTIRDRAGLPPLATNDKQELLAAIEKERRIELFAEWGHRWFDLKRTGRIGAVLGAAKPGWQPSDALYPIPASELLRNPFLTQNPGY